MGAPSGARATLGLLCGVALLVALIVAIAAAPALADTPLLLDNFNPSGATANSVLGGDTSSFTSGSGMGVVTLNFQSDGQVSEEDLTYSLGSPADISSTSQLEIDYSSITSSLSSGNVVNLVVTITDSGGNTLSYSEGVVASGVSGSIQIPYADMTAGTGGSASLTQITQVELQFQATDSDSTDNSTINLTAIAADNPGDDLTGAQTINFPQPSSGTVGGSEVMSATGGTSGNPVTFAVDTVDSSPSDACSLEGDGVTVEFNHAGTCVITASQAGNTFYSAASDVSDSITVGQASQSITFPQPSSGTVGGNEAMSATGGASGEPVTFAVDTVDSSPSDACSLEGDGVTVDLNHAGTCVVVASQAGNDDYSAASDVSRSIAVGQASQSINFPQPSSGAVGGNEAMSATGGASGEPVTFAVDTVDSSPSDACSLEGDGVTVDLNHAGTCVVVASQAGNDDYTAATSVSRSIAVGQASQSITFPQPSSGTVGGNEAMSATGGASGEPVTFAVDTVDSSPSDACSLEGDGVTVDFAHAGTCVVTASQAGNGDYTAAMSVSKSITVGPATPQVSLGASPSSNPTVVTPVTLTATVTGVAHGPAPAGTVSFAMSGSPISGCGEVALSSGSASCDLGKLPAGTYSFTATYSGDSDYVAGTPGVTSGFVVAKLSTTGAVVLPASAIVYGEQVSASDTFTSGGSPVSGGTVQWLTDNQPLGAAETPDSSGTVHSPSLAGLSVGTHVLTADYQGTSIYRSSSQSFNVVISKASTATRITVDASRLTARIRVLKPGAGRPSGTVMFSVKGQRVGTARVSLSGIATLSHVSPGAEHVSATYSGDASFKASSARTATKNPKITFTVTSGSPETPYGWYSTPVKLTFRCTIGTAPLIGGCPRSVVVSRSGGAQTVVRTIHATDGGIATAIVSPINIDRNAPTLKVITSSAGSAASGQPVRCVAHAISGLVHACHVTIIRHGSTLEYRATAVSRAGLRTTRTGSVSATGA